MRYIQKSGITNKSVSGDRGAYFLSRRAHLLTTDKSAVYCLRQTCALRDYKSNLKGASNMSNAQWEYENQEFLRARYEDKKWYTVRKHVCLECGKEYFTICNFRKYCSDACCAEAERKRNEERKSAHHSEHICKVCGKSFSSKRTDAQYCSNGCRQKSYRAEKR